MTLILATLLVLSVESPFEPWIRKVLEKEDETAHAVLVRRGTPALAELESARKKADPAGRKRLDTIIREIKAREPHGLSFFAGLPKMRLTPETEVTFALTVRNRSDKTVVLYPYLSLRLLKKDGTEVKPARRIGRGGLRKPGHPLDDVKFVTLEPGKRWTFEESLGRYEHDPAWITGWKNPGVGVYTLEFTYAFDRKQADGIGDEKHPARKALAFRHVFRQELRIDP